MSNIKQQLKDFLIFAAENGYANPSAMIVRESDTSDTIHLQKDEWKLDDNYFTSEDGRRYHGRETVFYKGKPYWFIAYSGFVNDLTDPGIVYTFLKKAMLKPIKNFPVRGPKAYNENEWKYNMHIPSCNLNEFTAEETIKNYNKEVYKAYFIGGLIN